MSVIFPDGGRLFHFEDEAMKPRSPRHSLTLTCSRPPARRRCSSGAAKSFTGAVNIGFPALR